MTTAALIVRSCVVSLFLLLAIWTARIFTSYWKTWRASPAERRALPAHVLLVSTGTLILAGTLTVLIYHNAGRERPVTWYVVATFIGDAAILAALVLLDQWQSRTRRRP